MQGKKLQLTYTLMNHVFGFKRDGLCDPLSSFRLNEFWMFLTVLQTPFDSRKGKAMFIKDLKYWLLHKVLACVIFHKTEFNRVSAQELFLMWCTPQPRRAAKPAEFLSSTLCGTLQPESPLEGTLGHGLRALLL